MTGQSRPAVRVEPLADHHDRTLFQSGEAALDQYFRMQAGQDVRRRVASCFVLAADDKSAPIGFYTLASTAVALADLPPKLAKRLPRYPAIPATVMGRLAVDGAHRGQGWGSFLLMDAFARTLRSEIATFAFVVDAKNDAAEVFYKAHGFMPLTQAGRRLFMSMAEVAKLFA